MEFFSPPALTQSRFTPNSRSRLDGTEAALDSPAQAFIIKGVRGMRLHYSTNFSVSRFQPFTCCVGRVVAVTVVVMVHGVTVGIRGGRAVRVRA
jgi:hypothetical protein